MVPYAEGEPVVVGGPSLELILSYLLIALIFGLINGIIGNAIRIVAFPIYILTLGLISLVVNAVLLLLVTVVSEWLGFGLFVQDFYWGIIGALVLSLAGWIIGMLLLDEQKRTRVSRCPATSASRASVVKRGSRLPPSRFRDRSPWRELRPHLPEMHRYRCARW